MPESLPEGFARLTAGLPQATVLNRTATLRDLGSVAAFVASDQSRTLTSTDVNISCGATVDYPAKREVLELDRITRSSTRLPVGSSR